MRKVRKDSKEKLPNTTKTKRGSDTIGRKNKRSDEKKPEPETKNVRQRKQKPEILKEPEVNIKVEQKEPEIKFNPKHLKTGDKFTFKSPGKGNKVYTCTVKGREIEFIRDEDKHVYTRQLSDLSTIIETLKLECKLIEQ